MGETQTQISSGLVYSDNWVSADQDTDQIEIMKCKNLKQNFIKYLGKNFENSFMRNENGTIETD